MVDIQRINDKLLVRSFESIGKGAFGVVLRGEYDNAPCAVKMLHHTASEMRAGIGTGAQGQEEAIKAFQKECEFLESIDHPNIVKHFSTSEHPKSGNILLVLELMDHNLRYYLSHFDDEPLTVYCQISLSKDVASGLAYLHSRKIIHRDLCGDNILLKLSSGPSRSVPIAKISDFGMSRLLDPSQLSSTLSAIGHRMGYLPPEALRFEDEKYNNSLDVFSLGVVMVQVVHKLENIKSPKDRSHFAQKIPETHPLKASIFKCLEDQKDNRPTTIDIYHTLSDQLSLLERSSTDSTAENENDDQFLIKNRLRDHVYDNLLDSVSYFKRWCRESKYSIIFFVIIFFVYFVVMVALGGGYEYCRKNIQRVGESEVIQSKRTGMLPIGEIEPIDRQILTFFQTGMDEVSRLQFYCNDCDKVNTSQVPIRIQDTFHPITSNELDVRYIQFDTDLVLELEIQTTRVTAPESCFLKLLVFNDLMNFQIFLNRGMWSDKDLYTEVCVNQKNFSTNIALNEKSYYYIGVHTSSDSQRLIEGDIMYRITGVAQQYDIDSFLFACSMNNYSRECQVHFSDIGVTATTTRACILGYVPGVNSETKRVSIEYQTNGVLSSTLTNVFVVLTAGGCAFVVLVFGCVVYLVEKCCSLIRRHE